MSAGEPGILVDDAAEPVPEPVVRAFPQRAKSARRGHDGVVVDTVARADLGDLVWHAGAAGDPVDQSPGAFEHTVQDALGGCHFPQHVHVYAALPAAPLIGDARLMDAAGDRVGDEFLVALAPGPAEIELRDQLPGLRTAVGVDAGKGADGAGRGPRTGTLPIR